MYFQSFTFWKCATGTSSSSFSNVECCGGMISILYSLLPGILSVSKLVSSRTKEKILLLIISSNLKMFKISYDASFNAKHNTCIQITFKN